MSEEAKMPHARLLTAEGKFVTLAEVLPFDRWPDVLVWGTRLFQFERSNKDDGDDLAEYRECFAWYVIHDSPDDPGALPAEEPDEE